MKNTALEYEKSLEKKEEEQIDSTVQKSQGEYLNEIQSNNEPPPRTPVDIKFRQTGPQFSIDPSLLDKDEDELADDEESFGEMDQELNPRNFLSGVYQNDEFMKLKSQFENELI